MIDETQKKDFNNEIVLQYDDNIARVVAGYDLMTSIAVAHCQVHCGENARILIVGAGTGHELEKLCNANPTWTFVAVEPAEAMLKQAKNRCQAHDSRIQWHNGTLDTLETSINFDICVCLLVIHFLDELIKRELLQQIAKNLTPSGELLLSQRMLIDDEPFLSTEVAHALSHGHPIEKEAMLRQRLLDLPALRHADASELYQHCGFTAEQTLLQVLSYQLTCLKVA